MELKINFQTFNGQIQYCIHHFKQSNDCVHFYKGTNKHCRPFKDYSTSPQTFQELGKRHFTMRIYHTNFSQQCLQFKCTHTIKSCKTPLIFSTVAKTSCVRSSVVRLDDGVSLEGDVMILGTARLCLTRVRHSEKCALSACKCDRHWRRPALITISEPVLKIKQICTSD